VRIFNVTFDAADAVALAGFWAQVVERPVDEGANEHFARIDGGGDEPNLLFIQVPEPRGAKNRVHVDLDAPTLADARARLEGLGATFVHEKDEYGLRWFTFQDPEGNEFCVGSHE
jgi:catechol 2,3-dioxygenase-like lactoylglutathione lyase family enzyme